MYKTVKIFCISVALMLQVQMVFAQNNVFTVGSSAKAVFKTIQEAINQIPENNSNFITILIEPGIYQEKIFIKNKHQFQLIGSGMDKTIISQSIARDAWRCEHNDDWGVATINVDSSTAINFKDLTIENRYGFDNKSDILIPCALDSTLQKLVKSNGHQMAFRSFYATKLAFSNCHFKAFGGDTMSPWNTTDGMFYLKDCVLEGGVDFYCPRGWAYAENCSFYSHNGPAAIWHDGSLHEDAKSVLVKCTFNGFEGFKLGRYHRDAQIYLIDCAFAKNMSDQPIYQVKTNNKLDWPGRVYYQDCFTIGTQNQVFKNNLFEAKGSPKRSAINAEWVFGIRWSPLEQLNVRKKA